jgi:GTP-binding protein
MAVQRHPPPAVNGRRVRPKYMAQTKARPPTFVLFASRADQLPDSYRRYLVNSIRESFDLPGVPIRVTVKSNKNPYAEGEEKAGQGSARAPFGVTLPTTGLKAKRRTAAAEAARSAGEGKPKAPGKPKPKGPMRGKKAKLNRPGVKPKRASRSASTPKRRR